MHPADSDSNLDSDASFRTDSVAGLSGSRLTLALALFNAAFVPVERSYSAALCVFPGASCPGGGSNINQTVNIGGLSISIPIPTGTSQGQGVVGQGQGQGQGDSGGSGGGGGTGG